MSALSFIGSLMIAHFERKSSYHKERHYYWKQRWKEADELNADLLNRFAPLPDRDHLPSEEPPFND